MGISILARGSAAAEIRLDGPIGSGLAGDGLTSRSFADALAPHRGAKVLTVRINSPGGAVFDGIAIYNQLRAHGTRVEVVVEGLAASIASLIAMAGDSIRMAEGSLLMIHNPWTLAVGDSEALRATADVLDKVGDQMLGIYAARTGLEPDTIRELLAAETWLSGPEAVERGFATVADEREASPAAAARDAHRSSFNAFRGALAASSRQLQPAAIHRLHEELRMTQPITPAPAAHGGPDVLALEVQRRREIRDMFSGRLAAEHRELLDQCLDDPAVTPAAASRRLLAALGAGSAPIGGASAVSADSISASHRGVRDLADFSAAASDALLMRAGIVVEKPHPAAKDLKGTSLADIAGMVMSQMGKRTLGGAAQRIEAALTTSDYPELLRNTAGKAMSIAYEDEPASHRAWVYIGDARDFKQQARVSLGTAPDLLLTPEGAPYQLGSFGERAELFALDTYGRMMKITRQALVNDDLGAFTTIPTMFGQAARRREADLVYALLTVASGAGKTMSDGQPLFHSTHNNIATGTGLNAATLGSARTLLRKQTTTDGIGFLNLMPRYLIVPAEAEFTAEVLLAQATRTQDVTATGGRTTGVQAAPNPQWVSNLRLVVEPRLPATFAYIASGRPQIDTVELALLDGVAGPRISDDVEFSTDGLLMKAVLDVGATVIDWRGMVRIAL